MTAVRSRLFLGTRTKCNSVESRQPPPTFPFTSVCSTESKHIRQVNSTLHSTRVWVHWKGYVFLVNVFASWIVKQLRHKTGAQPSARIRRVCYLLARVKHLKAFSQGQFCLHPLLRPFLLLKTLAVQTDCMRIINPVLHSSWNKTISLLLPLSPHFHPSEDSNHSSQASGFSSHLLNSAKSYVCIPWEPPPRTNLTAFR